MCKLQRTHSHLALVIQTVIKGIVKESVNKHTVFCVNEKELYKDGSFTAVVEGRGQARREVGVASLDLRCPQLTLAQFSDTHTYTRTLTKLTIFNPLEVRHQYLQQTQITAIEFVIVSLLPSRMPKGVVFMKLLQWCKEFKLYEPISCYCYLKSYVASVTKAS